MEGSFHKRNCIARKETDAVKMETFKNDKYLLQLSDKICIKKII